MATWKTELPGPADEGTESHVEDHNKIRAALEELRERVDALEAPKTRKRTTSKSD